MDYKKLLVLTDFSQDADDTLRDAVTFAMRYDAEITILHVIQDETNLSFILSDSEYHNIEKKLEAHCRRMFASLEDKISDLKKVSYRTKTRKGVPYINCLYEIEAEHYDLVFIASHGRSALRSVFVGSTAEKVMRRSPVSVFVTRR